MTIDIEKLAKEAELNIPSQTWGEVYVKLKAFSEAYAAKVLEDKEREIAELKTTVRSDNSKVITALKANVNDLREALEDISKEPYKDQSDLNTIRKVIEIAKHSLSKTPAQSLQAFENEVIEMVASAWTCDCDDCPDNIRALKATNE